MTAGFPNRKLEFVYDYAGRRVQKIVFEWSGSAWAVPSARRFIYDGWNVVVELSSSDLESFSLLRSYTWGLDIRGSLGATGGVGALLQLKDHTSGDTYFPAHDGNGNVMGLYDSADGTAVAIYEYSPFGELTRAEGDYAKENPIRFSSKFTDDETGLIYYGYRYYHPGLGRFINRDPIGEAGGNNLYGFAGNDPVNGIDVLGLDGDEGKDDRGFPVLDSVPFPNSGINHSSWMTVRYDGLSSWQQAFDEAFDIMRRDAAIRAGQAESRRQWDEQVSLGRKIDSQLVYRASTMERNAARYPGSESGRIPYTFGPTDYVGSITDPIVLEGRAAEARALKRLGDRLHEAALRYIVLRQEIIELAIEAMEEKAADRTKEFIIAAAGSAITIGVAAVVESVLIARTAQAVAIARNNLALAVTVANAGRYGSEGVLAIEEAQAALWATQRLHNAIRLKAAIAGGASATTLNSYLLGSDPWDYSDGVVDLVDQLIGGPALDLAPKVWEMLVAAEGAWLVDTRNAYHPALETAASLYRARVERAYREYIEATHGSQPPQR